LIEIGDFIRPNNPTKAANFVDQLIDRCHRLAAMPRAYPLVPRYEYLGIRRYVFQDYLIFYRVQEDLVEIIRVINGVQDYEKFLFTNF
jgi:addiction module RelE/StbE family toxin